MMIWYLVKFVKIFIGFNDMNIYWLLIGIVRIEFIMN